jgi:2'-5' RNA ligase
VAIKLSAETNRGLSELIEKLRTPGDGISWARPTNLHLTLRFLGGSVDSSLIAPLAEALRRIAERPAPIVVEARGIGAFPDLARPRVIWAGIEGANLLDLAREVEQAAVECGFEPERRPYSAHLTLGRVRELRRWAKLRGKLEALAERDFGRSTIETMILYESRLSPPEHREIACFRFGGM